MLLSFKEGRRVARRRRSRNKQRGRLLRLAAALRKQLQPREGSDSRLKHCFSLLWGTQPSTTQHTRNKGTRDHEQTKKTTDTQAETLTPMPEYHAAKGRACVMTRLLSLYRSLITTFSLRHTPSKPTTRLLRSVWAHRSPLQHKVIPL